MKKLIIITILVVFGFILLPQAFAGEKSKCIYGSKIDQSISFYQARLYLLDSEYKILSDIGKDARKRINYLYNNKQKLVREMQQKDIGFKFASINCFVNKKYRDSGIGLAYTKE